MSAEDRTRYAQAMHGVQSAIAFEIGTGVMNADHKHLRVGIDSAHVSQGALAELLVEKGLITVDEYDAKLAHYAERELLSYEAKYPRVRFR
jgi:hypothetical protein